MSILCIEKHFANEAVINTGSTFTSNVIVFSGIETTRKPVLAIRQLVQIIRKESLENLTIT